MLKELNFLLMNFLGIVLLLSKKEFCKRCFLLRK